MTRRTIPATVTIWAVQCLTALALTAPVLAILIPQGLAAAALIWAMAALGALTALRIGFSFGHYVGHRCAEQDLPVPDQDRWRP